MLWRRRPSALATDRQWRAHSPPAAYSRRRPSPSARDWVTNQPTSSASRCGSAWQTGQPASSNTASGRPRGSRGSKLTMSPPVTDRWAALGSRGSPAGVSSSTSPACPALARADPRDRGLAAGCEGGLGLAEQGGGTVQDGPAGGAVLLGRLQQRAAAVDRGAEAPGQLLLVAPQPAAEPAGGLPQRLRGRAAQAAQHGVGVLCGRSPRLGQRPRAGAAAATQPRSEEHTSELQSRVDLVCRLLLEKKKQQQ